MGCFVNVDTTIFKNSPMYKIDWCIISWSLFIFIPSICIIVPILLITVVFNQLWHQWFCNLWCLLLNHLYLVDTNIWKENYFDIISNTPLNLLSPLARLDVLIHMWHTLIVDLLPHRIPHPVSNTPGWITNYHPLPLGDFHFPFPLHLF